MADVKYGIEELFNAVKTNHAEKAKYAIEKAQQEVAILEKIKHVSDLGKASIQNIKAIIKHVSKDEMKDAKKKYSDAERKYNGHLKGYLHTKLKEIKEVEALDQLRSSRNQTQNPKTSSRAGAEEGNEMKYQQPNDQKNAQFEYSTPNASNVKNENIDLEEQGPHYNLEKRQKDLCDSTKTQLKTVEENLRTNDVVEKRRSFKASDDFQLRKESKRASQAMSHNNPDIADLSDTNRPTKIAERFSELYDNEWTEAFESLSKKNKTEKETIEYLLSIVKTAYKFCEKKAEEELKLIVKAFDRILEFGPQEYTKGSYTSQSGISSEESKCLINQYRKEMAGISLPRLKKTFTDEILHDLKTKFQLPTRFNALDPYAEKAVELTWWMCVQNPPVFLCPTDESRKEEFDSKLYRTYTKSGTRPDFFVWPALRLYKEGGVLMKGVVQYI